MLKDSSKCEVIKYEPLPFYFGPIPQTVQQMPSEQIAHYCDFPATVLIKHSEMWMGSDLASWTYWCYDCDKSHTRTDRKHAKCYNTAQKRIMNK